MIREGEVITSIDGDDVLGVPDERALLRGKAGRKVMLRVKDASGQTRDVSGHARKRSALSKNLRYNEWEYSRRLKVDSDSHAQIGYVHLRAMGSGDIDQWVRDFYPVFNRQGLIIDVRHNGGGNIDSWVLGKLLRKAWFYWQPRVGNPTWNMQYAFRGHIVVLCDEYTGSDGEAFTEGIRRLGHWQDYRHAHLGRRNLAVRQQQSLLTEASPPPLKSASTAPKANGSSKVTASIPT